MDVLFSTFIFVQLNECPSPTFLLPTQTWVYVKPAHGNSITKHSKSPHFGNALLLGPWLFKFNRTVGFRLKSHQIVDEFARTEQGAMINKNTYAHTQTL
jgi:hypothetical protein